MKTALEVLELVKNRFENMSVEEYNEIYEEIMKEIDENGNFKQEECFYGEDARRCSSGKN